MYVGCRNGLVGCCKLIVVKTNQPDHVVVVHPQCVGCIHPRERVVCWGMHFGDAYGMSPVSRVRGKRPVELVLLRGERTQGC